jgi:hypothetical protein
MTAAARGGPAAGRPAGTLLPTTVIGSYAVPEWLGQLKNDYCQRRISKSYLDEIHEMAIKAAILDQERAGIDIVSDGELRRDNDIDYLLARIPGVEIPQRAKADYFDYYGRPGTRPRAGRGFPLYPAAHGHAGQGLHHRAVLAVAPDPQHGLRGPGRSRPGPGPAA